MYHFKTMAFVGALLAILAVISCSQTPPQSPTPIPVTPTTNPIPTPTQTSVPPTPTTVLTPTSSERLGVPQIERVIERFGFALLPEYLPQELKPSRVSMTRNRAQIFYGDVEEKLIVAYPVEFSPQASALMQELGIIRPNDALTEVQVNNQSGYLRIGGWSEATILQGPSINPASAEWDYDSSLTLFYDYNVSDSQSMGIAVQALVNPQTWITHEELVKIAESIMRTE